ASPRRSSTPCCARRARPVAARARRGPSPMYRSARRCEDGWHGRSPVTALLDTLPFDFSRPEARELRRLLAAAYRRPSAAEAIREEAGIDPGTIHFEQPMLDVWHDVLREAANQGLARALIDRVLADTRSTRWHPRVRELIADVPVVEAPAP